MRVLFLLPSIIPKFLQSIGLQSEIEIFLRKFKLQEFLVNSILNFMHFGKKNTIKNLVQKILVKLSATRFRI